jgi:hypothetical protein
MPKPRHIIDPQILQRLKSEISHRVGIEVRNRPDCVRMSVEIKQKFGVNISDSTFKRLYLDLGVDNHFYLDTLDKLCSVIDKDLKWNDYHNAISNARLNLKDLDLELGVKTSNSLLFINFENSHWKTLRVYFDRLQTEVNESNFNIIYISLGTQLHRIARTDSKFELNLYKHFSDHLLVRNSFFERLADPNFTLPNYEKGLELYRRGTNLGSHSAANDICFKLCMTYLNRQNKASFKELNTMYSEIMANFGLDFIGTDKIHSYNVGRVLCVMLAHTKVVGSVNFENVFAEIIQFISVWLRRWDSFEQRVVLFYCFQGLSSIEAHENYFFQIEKVFCTSYLSRDGFKESLNLFLYEKEPNSLIWIERNGTL